MVRKLSFQAPDGEITGLLGANGAGKTTTLRMICGVMKPDSGSISIDGTAGDPFARQRRLGALLEMQAACRLLVVDDKWMARLSDVVRGGFLGFEYRRILSRNGMWRPNYAPKLKKRTALFAKLREVFRRNVSQPVGRVIKEINPILRAWVSYFRVGHSNRCFSMISHWVEKKIRRQLMRARGRPGMGWKRWSREWVIRETRTL